MSEQTLDRFMAKVEKTGTCWLWTAGRFSNGYASFRLGGKSCLAHRVAYEWLVGPIPVGLQIDHLCGVKHCINPAHLEAKTPREHRGRHASLIADCPRGHAYDEANTYRFPDGRRKCRQCQRIDDARRRAARCAS